MPSRKKGFCRTTNWSWGWNPLLLLLLQLVSKFSTQRRASLACSIRSPPPSKLACQFTICLLACWLFHKSAYQIVWNYDIGWYDNHLVSLFLESRIWELSLDLKIGLYPSRGRRLRLFSVFVYYFAWLNLAAFLFIRSHFLLFARSEYSVGTPPARSLQKPRPLLP